MASAEAKSPNQVAGTWRMVSAHIDPDGKNLPAYGDKPNGLLVFTDDMRFIEVLTDPAILDRPGAHAQGSAPDRRG